MIKKILIMLSLMAVLTGCRHTAPPAITNLNPQSTMELSSTDFSDNTAMDSRLTCDGENERPHLRWRGVPAGAKSVAIAVFDPDAPSGGWVHWLAVNLPPQDGELAARDQLPGAASEITNDFGRGAYGGPCPPSGQHRYQYTVYALDIGDIRPVDYDDFLRQIQGHVLDQAQLTGLYQRLK